MYGGQLEFQADGRLFNSVVDESVVEWNKLSGDNFDHFLGSDAADQ